MTPALLTDRAAVFVGDSLHLEAILEDNVVDAVVTDPPYELGFMGKAWDSSGIANNPALWRELLRVMKPGAHLIAFSHSRTVHRMTCAIEDAGFEIRDSLDWLYGTGFPKGGKRGTNLKPGKEPIVLARKPLIGTVAANVKRYGVGLLGIDACRLPTADDRARPASGAKGINALGHSDTYDSESHPLGRWPANVLLDEDAAAELDAQCAGASRFFYVAKPSKAERSAGCDHLPERTSGEMCEREEGSAGLTPAAGAGRSKGAKNYHPTVKPVELMRYLCRLVAPPGGMVLDPFVGSGTTGVAAVLEGFEFVGVDQSAEYAEIAKARVEHALKGES